MELKADKLHKTYGPVTILDDITFAIEKGQKVGLVGYNGTGKSTLLKILAGVVEPDGGTITTRKGAVIGYMPQDTSLVSSETMRDYLRRVSGIGQLEDSLDASEGAVSEYERREGYAFDHRMDLTLAGLGLTDVSTDRPINSLSSGQKSKVFMAGVLLSDPDVLLLDEPTNNLDLPALIWLEDFLSRSETSCLMVSHDRMFLDRLVRKIFEIDWITRKLTIVNGRYSDYIERKEKERARLWAEHEDQREEIKRLGDQAKELKKKSAVGSQYMGTDNDKFHRGFHREKAGRSGKTAKAIEKRIEQMDVVERPIDRDVLRIHLEASKPEGSRDIVLTDVSSGYEGFRVGPLSLHVPYGSRVAILGLNGSGKSTLLKTIAGEIKSIEGKVHLGGGLVVGNLMQEHDNLPRKESIKDFLVKRADLSVSDAYTLAVQYRFKAEEMERDMATLSPGGRARVLFALFSALSANLLILDEPTNHLDLEALEALEEMIAHYAGTVLLVSHDRHFLEKFGATDTYMLDKGQLVKQASYEAYLASAEKEAHRLINLL